MQSVPVERAAMKVARREFVTTAGCAAAAGLCPFPSFGTAAGNSANARAKCTLLDLKSNCALPESLAGMQGALGIAHRRVAIEDLVSGAISFAKPATKGICNVVVVAAAGSVTGEAFGAVTELLNSGATILWESGSAFLDPRKFAEQQRFVQDCFDISIEQPIDVWMPTHAPKLNFAETNRTARATRAIGHKQVAYIEYRWPRETHVRDYSRIIPVTAATGRAIAHWGKIPVSWSKPVGTGTLVFFGSPIGPALHAGDAEAHALLQSIVAL